MSENERWSVLLQEITTLLTLHLLVIVGRYASKMPPSRESGHNPDRSFRDTSIFHKEVLCYDSAMLKFDTVLQTFQSQFVGSIISVKKQRTDGKMYRKINDKQNQLGELWEN